MIAKKTIQIINSLANSSLQVSLHKSQLKKQMQRNYRLQFSLQFRHLSQTVCKEISFQYQSITTKPVCSFVCRNANFETNSEK
jgi:hypothetical protein